MTYMATFTEWLRQQMRQERLSCRTLAQRCGLTATKIRLAVEQDVAPSAYAVRRLARYFGADQLALLRSAAEQVATTMIAATPQERELVCALYTMTPAEVRLFTADLQARVAGHRARPQAAVA